MASPREKGKAESPFSPCGEKVPEGRMRAGRKAHGAATRSTPKPRRRTPALTIITIFDTAITMTRKKPKGAIATDETFDEFLASQGLLAEAESRARKELEHLLRSPANVKRLTGSIAEFDAGGGTEHKFAE